MKIAVFPNLTRQRAFSVTVSVCSELTKLGLDFAFPLELKQQLSSVDGASFVNDSELIAGCDFVISIGGDGSVIRAAKQAAVRGKRILGINAGNLAYLCGLDADELSLLSALKNNQYTVQHRIMLEASHYSQGKLVGRELCINDISFGRGEQIGLADIRVKANGKPMADYIADGIIIATPTGSTAYSMSAGGAIVEPTLQALLLTPVCPHSLVMRPYIFNSETEFEVSSINERCANAGFSCDGSPTVTLSDGDFVKVKKAGIFAEFISIKTDNFIDVLNKKLELR